MIGKIGNTKFVFYGVCKTGSTSILKALNQYAIDSKKHQPRLSINQNIEDHIKFLIVRNPWDRYVSLYEWGNQISKDPLANSFEDFIIRLTEDKDFLFVPKQKNWSMAQIDWSKNSDGQYDFDYLGKFENMQNVWSDIQDLLSLKINLPHEYKVNRRDYKDYYTSDLVDRVENFAKKDIEHFDYEYE